MSTQTAFIPTETHFPVPGLINGVPVVFMADRATEELMIPIDSVAIALGFESVEEMMSDDRVLDIINKNSTDTGKFPIQTITVTTIDIEV